MADALHRAPPVVKPIHRAETRPLRRVDNVTEPERRVPFMMSGREPHLMLHGRLDGRGAGVWQAADVLALQHTLGNRATQRALDPHGQSRAGSAALRRPHPPRMPAMSASATIQRNGGKKKKD
ncbi:MAG: hypothetical protein ACRDJH_11040 [Thermomicrobiales bacterium]